MYSTNVIFVVSNDDLNECDVHYDLDNDVVNVMHSTNAKSVVSNDGLNDCNIND